jgi:hypothetical protein
MITEAQQPSGLFTDRNKKLIKGTVTDLDMGNITASILIKSGGRLISLLMPVGEVLAAQVEINREVYCLIEGKDITLFRDPKEYFRLKEQSTPVNEIYLGN